MKIHLLTKKGKSMSPSTAFDTVVKDGTLTILLVPDGQTVEVDGNVIRPGLESDFEEPRKVERALHDIRNVTKSVGLAKEQSNPFAGLVDAGLVETYRLADLDYQEKSKQPSEEKPKQPSEEKPKQPSAKKPKQPSAKKPKQPSEEKPKQPSAKKLRKQ